LWRFYWDILCAAVKEVGNTIERVAFWVTAVLSILGLANRRLLQAIEHRSNGVSPWWSMLPIATWLAYRLIRTNYNRFQRLQLQGGWRTFAFL
jgi:hypothetical protein